MRHCFHVSLILHSTGAYDGDIEIIILIRFFIASEVNKIFGKNTILSADPIWYTEDGSGNDMSHFEDNSNDIESADTEYIDSINVLSLLRRI